MQSFSTMLDRRSGAVVGCGEGPRREKCGSAGGRTPERAAKEKGEAGASPSGRGARAAGEPYCVDEAAALDRTAALPWALPPLLRAATAPEPLRPASCTRWKLMTLRR